MIVCCMSLYREGALALGAFQSALAAADLVIVSEGAIGASDDSIGEPTPLEEMRLLAATLPRDAIVLEPSRPYLSDAAKRTHLLNLAKEHAAVLAGKDEPVWVVWLDGDELLLWGEYLRDMTSWAHENETAAGGFPLRIVELDGSVAYSYGRVFRAEPVRKFLEGSYQVELHTGMVVALPNVPICGAGGIPVAPAEGVPDEAAQGAWLARCRPPVQGEPHILHRSALRRRDRAERRVSDLEGERWRELAGEGRAA